MLIGVPAASNENKNRVAITPAGVAELTHHGHLTLVDRGSGGGGVCADDGTPAEVAALRAEGAPPRAPINQGGTAAGHRDHACAQRATVRTGQRTHRASAFGISYTPLEEHLA